MQHRILDRGVLVDAVNRSPERAVSGILHWLLRGRSSERGLMASYMSVLQWDGFCSYSPARRKVRVSYPVTPSVKLSSWGTGYSTGVAGCLRIGRDCGDALLARRVVNDATAVSGRECGGCMNSQRRRDFHVAKLSSLTAGFPADLPIDGAVREEQLEASTTFTDLKTDQRKSLTLVSGSCYLPHPEKVKTGGEDAHFICTKEQSVGVADGVGGWVEWGVNAGIYAQQLMSHSAAAIQQEADGSIDLIRVLGKAFSLTQVLGSSTACIIVLTEQCIRAANLGDSGFIIVRDGCTLFQSPPQQHGFNFPYQLEFSGNADHPSSAEIFAVDVAAGDVLVAGTDGLFDNLFGEEISTIVRDAIQSGLSPNETADNIARTAQLRAMNMECETPFSTAARKAGVPYRGGKLDDITVVVSYIA